MTWVGITVTESLRNELLISVLKPHASRLAGAGTLATSGTHDFLEEQGLLGNLRQDHTHRHLRLPPANTGGVIQIANAVVKDLCKTVVFIADPQEPTLDTPEQRALIRVCIHKKVTLIQTTDDLEYWLEHARPTKPAAFHLARGHWYSLSPTHTVPPFSVNVTATGRHRRLPRRDQTVALVAHDRVKYDMYLFAVRYRKFLKQFGRVIATGTTGRHVHELTALNVEAFESGPKGGDVEIAAEILDHRCHWLIFFIDPLTAHPHIEDVRMLQRTCLLPGVFCRAFFSPETAAYAASGPRASF